MDEDEDDEDKLHGDQEEDSEGLPNNHLDDEDADSDNEF